MANVMDLPLEYYVASAPSMLPWVSLPSYLIVIFLIMIFGGLPG